MSQPQGQKQLPGKPNGTGVPAAQSDLRKYLESRKNVLAEVAAGAMDPERIVKLALLAANKQPGLYKCEPASVFAALMELTRLGLEPGGAMGQAALVPYGTECQPQVMYQGICELAYRSSLVKSINAKSVHVGDAFDWQEGTDAFIHHKPSKEPGREARPWTHVYCIVETTNGGRIQDVMDQLAVFRIRAFSKDFAAKGAKSIWALHELRQSLKTVVLRTMKLAPKSAEMRQAMAMEAADAIETTGTVVAEAPPAQKNPNDVLEQAALRALGEHTAQETLDAMKHKETVPVHSGAGPAGDEPPPVNDEDLGPTNGGEKL